MNSKPCTDFIVFLSFTFYFLFVYFYLLFFVKFCFLDITLIFRKYDEDLFEIKYIQRERIKKINKKMKSKERKRFQIV